MPGWCLCCGTHIRPQETLTHTPFVLATLVGQSGEQTKQSSNLFSPTRASDQPVFLGLWFFRPETSTSLLVLSNCRRLTSCPTRSLVKATIWFFITSLSCQFSNVQWSWDNFQWTSICLPPTIILLILLHIYLFIHLFIPPPIHLISDTFQNKLHTSVYFPSYTLACILVTRIQYMFIFFRCKTYIWNVHIKCFLRSAYTCVIQGPITV